MSIEPVGLPYRRLELENDCVWCERAFEPSDRVVVYFYTGGMVVLVHTGCEPWLRDKAMQRKQRIAAQIRGNVQLPLPELGAAPYEVRE